MAITFNVSYYLTSEGVVRIFKKLFDPNTTYNKAFFSDATTPLKLRVYVDDSSTNFISSAERYYVRNNKLLFVYEFTEDLSAYNITSAKIFDGDKLLMDYTNADVLNRAIAMDPHVIGMDYTMNQITPCVPIDSLKLMVRSLGNLEDFKINRMFLGTGQPDLSGRSHELTNLLSSHYFTNVWYVDVDNAIRVEVRLNDRKFVDNDITEVGLGFYDEGELDNLDRPMDGVFLLDNVRYFLCTLQNTQFVRMSRKSPYKVIVTIYLV